MGLTNAERQRRYRQRLKQKARLAEAGGAPLAAAWDAASHTQRRAFRAERELFWLGGFTVAAADAPADAAPPETPVYNRLLADARAEAGESGRVPGAKGEPPRLPEDAAADRLYRHLHELVGRGPFGAELGAWHEEEVFTGKHTKKGKPKHKTVKVFSWYDRPARREPHLLWVHAERARADANRRETAVPPVIPPSEGTAYA